jgi:multidrug efflux system membrane fusion protein
MTGRNSRLIFFLLAGLAAVALVAGIVLSRQAKSRTAQPTAPPSIPVTVTDAAQQDVPIYYHALGTVMALNTVAIRAQINGQIISINFRQGQEVRQGDLLAKIDPAVYQATLDQAIAKKNQDQAQLIDAEKRRSKTSTPNRPRSINSKP